MKETAGFDLTVSVGKDGKQTAGHVALMLEKLSRRIGGGETTGVVRDENGNTVGFFAFGAEDA